MTDDRKEKIEKIAKSIKKKLREELNVSDFSDPFKVISLIDKYIIIRFKNDKEIQGFTLKKGDFRCIYINSSDVLGRQNYSCWHEFYHCIDDINEVRISKKGDKSPAEEEAEYFASCMLLDKEELDGYIRELCGSEKNLNEEELIKIQYKFNVSFGSLKTRLAEMYKNKKYFTYNINAVKNRIKYEEEVLRLGFDLQLISPTNDFCVPSLFINNLRENIISNRISLEKGNKIVEFLDEKGADIKW
ncbi:MAG: ImmA/IrrE family metallo-endopeptidase [Clostridium butyricum]|uniref:ImmA/IrrE family metallo-endopeptidase n=1 Tax=Clostridium sp. TaxID=1506 RepID=UPI0029049966|nr:ImmA/IrrE family metallo-endopeptidase [Clostridium sp.]MDU1116413.1 ImmA/IrrE family metallo-endopeptidase [Clostridium sp.]MDU7711302.1 ImmA/IrrE family metallo-endopeptidase [Clostridium butyricum]